ncbi:MAG: XTP/dITP diphosphatase [Methanomicrobium sp.]|nr:XTP/dITP diphosphatase [Methanomicrobium sp.]
MKEITVVTGNENKAREVAAFFEGICSVDHINMDLTEIQSDDIGQIAHFKAHEAYELLKKPVIVDDTGFFINAFKGFPGAYSAYVLDTIGISGILSLLAGLPDRNGTFVTAIAYADSEGIQVFEGEVKGKITKVPRGSNGFGYDPIFEYEGRTFAEIGLKEKSMISHRARALTEFKKWYVQNRA